MRAFIRGILPALAILFLVPAAFAQEAESADQAACADCHDTVKPAEFEATVHGGFGCTDCHTGAEEVPHPEGVAKVDCASCHSDAMDALARSIHGRPAF